MQPKEPARDGKENRPRDGKREKKLRGTTILFKPDRDTITLHKIQDVMNDI